MPPRTFVLTTDAGVVVIKTHRRRDAWKKLLKREKKNRHLVSGRTYNDLVEIPPTTEGIIAYYCK